MNNATQRQKPPEDIGYIHTVVSVRNTAIKIHKSNRKIVGISES